MSKFRDKAREIKEAGEAERGNFTPYGVPKRAYDYWLRNTDSVHGVAVRAGLRNENFCHFLRVVLFWAPLMWFVENVLLRKLTLVAVASTTAAALVLGAALSSSVLTFLIWVGVVLLGLATLAGVIAGIVVLVKRYWKNKWNDKLIIVPVAGAVGYGLFIITLGIIELGWIFLAYLFGGLLALVGFVYGAIVLADYIQGRRALAKKADREAIITEDGTVIFNTAPAKPRRVKKFFSGVADFLVFITQVVRVKKWKICPIVKVDIDNNL